LAYAVYKKANVEGMYSACRELLCRTVYFIEKTEQHAAQALALRERNHPSKFCGWIFLGSAVFRSRLQRDSLFNFVPV